MSDNSVSVAESTALRVTMVKKRLLSGEPCPKCVQASELIERRGLLEFIDEIVWAEEGQPESPGMVLAEKHGVKLAPFFIIERLPAGEDVGTAAAPPLAELELSTMKLVKVLEAKKAQLQAASSSSSPGSSAAAVATEPARLPLGPDLVASLSAELDPAQAERTVAQVLAAVGKNCGIAFSGAEDVALIEMAARSGLPYRIFCLDTGRLHPETYRFLDRVRVHYGVELEVYSPAYQELQSFVRAKGLFSFYQDGHQECCQLRKVEPLRRALAGLDAWMTGQRRDQSPTRAEVPLLAWDRAHRTDGLLKANPLAAWSLAEVWAYLRGHQVPVNELHKRGFISIGCEPCTRAIEPGEHERAGRWSWEDSTARECGLHLAKK